MHGCWGGIIAGSWGVRRFMRALISLFFKYCGWFFPLIFQRTLTDAFYLKGDCNYLRGQPAMTRRWDLNTVKLLYGCNLENAKCALNMQAADHVAWNNSPSHCCFHQLHLVWWLCFLLNFFHFCLMRLAMPRPCQQRRLATFTTWSWDCASACPPTRSPPLVPRSGRSASSSKDVN